MLADLEAISTDPWDGTCFGCAGSERRIGAGYAHGHHYQVELGPGSTTLSRDGLALLSANLRGRFRRLCVDDARLSIELPAAGDFTIRHAFAAEDCRVSLDGASLPATLVEAMGSIAGQNWTSLRIPPSARAQQLGIVRGTGS